MTSPDSKPTKGTDIYDADPRRRVEAWMGLISDSSQGQDWMNTLVPQLQLSSIEPIEPHASVTFALTVQQSHCNNMRTLHGGCTATIFDICTTLALASVARPGYWDMLGVTRTMNLTYMAAARAGDKVLITCQIVQAGRNLATLKGVMTKAENGQIIATCEHGKYNAGAVKKI